MSYFRKMRRLSGSAAKNGKKKLPKNNFFVDRQGAFS